MYPDPHVHSLIAADRAEILRADYAAARRPRTPRLRRRLGLGLVSLGLRLAGPRRTPTEAHLRSSRA